MILVTGAAGVCGSATLEQFSRREQPVRALVRRDGARANGPTVSVVIGDMNRLETLGPALDGVTTALLISTADERMAETQCRFIDAAKAHGVGRIVKLSGAESGIGFDASKFRFTRMHEDVERYLESSGLRWTHLRPSQFMQVYLREAPSVGSTGLLRLPLGDIELSPIDVCDVARVAHALLLNEGHDGKRYDITGPEALTMTAIARKIADATGRPVRYVAVTPEERRAALLANGAPASFADALHEQTVERLRHPTSQVRIEVHAMCGIVPTPFSDFVVRHRSAFLGHH